MALRRRTTLKALIEHALRREIQERPIAPPSDDTRFERNELGFLVLKRSPTTRLRLEDLRRLEETMEKDELLEALKPMGAP